MDIARLFYKVLNPAINALLSSPVHWVVSKRLMSIKFSGRKSGRSLVVPVNYFDHENATYCFTNGRWWNNFRDARPVSLVVRGKARAAIGQAVTDDGPACAEVMGSLIEQFPNEAKYYGVRLGKNKKPLPGEIERAMTTSIMIKFESEDGDSPLPR